MKSPVRGPSVQDDVPVDNSEIMKRIQSLHGKVESCRTDIKLVQARLSALEKNSNRVDAIGTTIITEKS